MDSAPWLNGSLCALRNRRGEKMTSLSQPGARRLQTVGTTGNHTWLLVPTAKNQCSAIMSEVTPCEP